MADKLTKKQIVRLLDQEVGLFFGRDCEECGVPPDNREDEWADHMQFKKFEEVLRQLQQKKKEIQVQKMKLRGVMKSNKRFIVIDERTDLIKDQMIHQKNPLAVLMIDSSLVMMNNVFYTKKGLGASIKQI